MNAQSLGNHQTLSAEKNFVKKNFSDMANMPKCPGCSPRYFGILISKILLKLRLLRTPRWGQKNQKWIEWRHKVLEITKKNFVKLARTELCQAQAKLIQIGRVLGKKLSLKGICWVKNIFGSNIYFWAKSIFWVKKILDQKKFGVKKNFMVQKNYGWKNFQVKNFFGSKTFLGQKKFSGQKLFPVKKNFRVKNFFRSKKIFGSKTFSGQKKIFGSKTFSGQKKIFGSKNFLGQKVFWVKKLFESKIFRFKKFSG